LIARPNTQAHNWLLDLNLWIKEAKPYPLQLQCLNHFLQMLLQQSKVQLLILLKNEDSLKLCLQSEQLAIQLNLYFLNFEFCLITSQVERST